MLAKHRLKVKVDYIKSMMIIKEIQPKYVLIGYILKSRLARATLAASCAQRDNELMWSKLSTEKPLA